MISICVPIYNMDNGVEFLKTNLNSIKSQTFTDYEIIVSDNSDSDMLKMVCEPYGVRYFKNPDKGMAQNTNFAIDKAEGDLIKILYQDDFFAHDDALKDISDFKGEWLITACSNNPHPFYSEHNTLGSPSVLTIRKGCPVRFDKRFYWVLDLDFYRQLYALYGEPTILNKINVVIGTGTHQISYKLSDKRKQIEEQLLKEKYEN